MVRIVRVEARRQVARATAFRRAAESEFRRRDLLFPESTRRDLYAFTVLGSELLGLRLCLPLFRLLCDLPWLISLSNICLWFLCSVGLGR